MEVVRDYNQGLFTLVPLDQAELLLLQYCKEKVSPDDTFFYRGKNGKLKNLKFQIGGTPMIESNSNSISPIYHGGFEFILKGDTTEDMDAIADIRDMCYFGSVDARFLNIAEVNGKEVIVITGGQCSLCDHFIITPAECHSKVCDNCSDLCDHEYDLQGLAVGGESNISYRSGCSKCLRTKPLGDNERIKSPVEEHLKLERELGITIIYKDDFITTPRKAVEAQRLIKKHQKAQDRK